LALTARCSRLSPTSLRARRAFTYYFAEVHIANRGESQAMCLSLMFDAIDAGSA
jgi:hypothetical protein